MLAGIGVVLVVIINTQIEISNGKLTYEPLPSSVDGCANGTVVGSSTRNITLSVDDSFEFYKISFLWYDSNDIP